MAGECGPPKKEPTCWPILGKPRVSNSRSAGCLKRAYIAARREFEGRSLPKVYKARRFRGAALRVRPLSKVAGFGNELGAPTKPTAIPLWSGLQPGLILEA